MKFIQPLPLTLALATLLGLLAAGTASAEEAGGLAAVLQPFVERHELAGAVVAVVSKEKVLDVETVGKADIAAGKPMTEDALFWIASQSKPMTATAFMMLVDEGKVSVEDPVEKYLPEFKGQMVTAEKDGEHVLLKKPARPVALRDLLSHTSGLAFSSPVESPTLDALPLRVAVRSYAMLPLQWEPGSKYQYSNAGINTVARVIEVITGKPYEQFMQERLFDPLGMTDTTFWPNAEQSARVAKSYAPNAAKNDLVEIPVGQLQYPLSDRVRRYPMPAGGLFSTTKDVARFCQMILNMGELDGHRYLSEQSLKQMTSRQTPAGLPESYGFGWMAGGTEAGHGGAFATNMAIDFKRGLAFVYMVQHAGFVGAGDKAGGAFRKAAQERFAR